MEKQYGLATGQLYMPQEWFSPEYEKRRKDTWVPDHLTFQTKPQIALALIREITRKNLFPVKWIGCDAILGSDPFFLASLPQGLYCLANVRSNTQVFLKNPRVGLPPYSGRGPRPKKLQILPGQPQPQTVSEIAPFRVFPPHKGLPQESSVWLLMRRTSGGQIRYAFSNPPEDMILAEMTHAPTLRCGIEQCFEDCKDQVGMGHYEHRSWPAWIAI